MNRKGQQEAVSAVLISGILIGVVGSVYFWGIPLIQKSRDVTLLENSENFIFLLDQKIKAVTSNGGRENIKIIDPGTLKLSGGRVFYKIQSDGTIYATNADIPLGLTTNCDDTKTGKFGSEDSSVICVTSNQVSSSNYENTYGLSYRSLASDLKTYKIALNGADSTGGPGSSIIIQNNGVTEVTQNGRQIITVNIGVTIG